MSAVNPQTPDESTPCMPSSKYIHESPHIWTEEIEIGCAPALLRQLCSEKRQHSSWEQADASQVEPFRPVFFRGVCMDLTGTYWTDLDDWDLNLLNSPGAVHSVPSCNTEAGWSVEVCGNRKQEKKWLLRNPLHDLTVGPVNICKRYVLQHRLSSDIWPLELGGSSLILLFYYWSRPANRDI